MHAYRQAPYTGFWLSWLPRCLWQKALPPACPHLLSETAFSHNPGHYNQLLNPVAAQPVRYPVLLFHFLPQGFPAFQYFPVLQTDLPPVQAVSRISDIQPDDCITAGSPMPLLTLFSVLSLETPFCTYSFVCLPLQQTAWHL